MRCGGYWGRKPPPDDVRAKVGNYCSHSMMQVFTIGLRLHLVQACHCTPSPSEVDVGGSFAPVGETRILCVTRVQVELLGVWRVFGGEIPDDGCYCCVFPDGCWSWDAG